MANIVGPTRPPAEGTGSLLDTAPYCIGSVALVVRDLDVLAGFYREVVGLTTVSQEADVVRLGVGATVLLELRRDAAARVMGDDVRADAGDVVARLRRQALAVPEIVLEPPRPGVVGRQEGRRAIEVVHLPDIGGAGHDAVVGVVGVAAEPVARLQFAVGAGHDLHQPHGADRAGGAAAAPGFLAHHLPHPALRHVETARGLPDVGAPGVPRRAGRVVAGRTVVAAMRDGRMGAWRTFRCLLAAGGEHGQHREGQGRSHQPG